MLTNAASTLVLSQSFLYAEQHWFSLPGVPVDELKVRTLIRGATNTAKGLAEK
jgi:hypothetical protein